MFCRLSSRGQIDQIGLSTTKRVVTARTELFFTALQHSTRDGGLHKPDTILMLLSWSYRNLRERINDCPEQIRTDFEHFAQRHVAAYTIQKWYVSTKNQLIFLNFLLFLILPSFLWHASLILVVNC